MWIMYQGGFISIVEKGPEGHFTVRARDRQSLEQLFGGDRVIAFTGTDYPFRVVAPKDEVVRTVMELTEAIAYRNFKDALKAKRGARWAEVAGRIWGALFTLEPKSVKKHYAKRAGSYFGSGGAGWKDSQYAKHSGSEVYGFPDEPGDDEAAEEYAMVAGGMGSIHRLTDEEWATLEGLGIDRDTPLPELVDVDLDTPQF